MKFLAPIIIVVTLAACASQGTPTGGPQDKKPPVLLKSSPKDNEKNFKSKSFELEFDEYIKLKNPNEEVLITPSLGKKTKIVAKKNKVIITPEKPTTENTTYNINFRDAVQDLNEGNPVFNLRLAFSTGPEIDSLKLTGSVSELFKEQIPEKITVAVYQSDTFNIFNHAPVYFTRTDQNGRFTITNLKAGVYYIYAFDDKNKNLKVDSKTERFAFKTQQIILNGKQPDSLKLSLARVDARPLKLTSLRNTDRLSRIRFNKAVDSVGIQATDYDLIYQYGTSQDEVEIFNPPKTDSLAIKIFAKDSIGHVIDTTAYIKTTNAKLPKDKFSIKFREPKYDLDKQSAIIEGTFNKPISGANLDSLYIQLDTLTFLPISKEDIYIDALRHNLKIEKKLKLKVADNTKTKAPDPIFVAGKSSFISIENDTSLSITSAIKILKEEQTGSLSYFLPKPPTHFLVELVNTNGVIIKTLRNTMKFTFKYLPPGDYKIRIINDVNNNGKWDIGNYYKGIEPEPVILYRTLDKKYSTPVRANWEVGPLNITF